MLGAVPPLKRGSDFSIYASQRLRAGLMNTAVPAGEWMKRGVFRPVIGYTCRADCGARPGLADASLLSLHR